MKFDMSMFFGMGNTKMMILRPGNCLGPPLSRAAALAAAALVGAALAAAALAGAALAAAASIGAPFSDVGPGKDPKIINELCDDPWSPKLEIS